MILFCCASRARAPEDLSAIEVILLLLLLFSGPNNNSDSADDITEIKVVPNEVSQVNVWLITCDRKHGCHVCSPGCMHTWHGASPLTYAWMLVTDPCIIGDERYASLDGDRCDWVVTNLYFVF